MRRLLAVCFVFAMIAGHASARDDGLTLATMLLEGSGDDRRLAMSRIRDDKRTDMIAPIVTMMRFIGPFAIELGSVLDEITGEDNGPDWHAWMLWQEANPQVESFAEYDQFTADLHARIDENFRLFLNPGVKHSIRLEEVVWGGVLKDGIPALNDPKHLDAADAAYLEDDELVFGVSINGDVRAYPMRLMDWHEMFNDIIGGVPVALAYCTLCGSGILYETGTSADDRIVFGSSGFLYRSNKLMYDPQTHSLWNQFTGEPVVGELTNQPQNLPLRPVTITSWANWVDAHPDTKVLSLETGFDRNYQPGAAYASYFASPDLMFPSGAAKDDRLSAKDHVFVMRQGAVSKTWPVSFFEDATIIHDQFNGSAITLIGDAATRTVRAYESDTQTFTQSDARTLLDQDGGAWQITEDALIGPQGTILNRLPGHVAFWFASTGFLPDGQLATN